MWLANLKLRIFTLAKVPLIAFVGPKIIDLDDERCVLLVSHCFRNRNHVGALYFGALTVGAELCGGMLAMHHIEKSGPGIVLVIKDFKADFKKLAKGDAHFICHEGRRVARLVKAAASDGKRHNLTVSGVAVVPSIAPDEPVMDFTVTLSVKKKG